jgi:hypothetical protein
MQKNQQQQKDLPKLKLSVDSTQKNQQQQFQFWSVLLNSAIFVATYQNVDSLKCYEKVFGSDDTNNRHITDSGAQDKRTVYGLDSNKATDLGH